MTQYPTPEAILNDLGDKVVDGIASAVNGAREDLTEYRSTLPHLASRHCARGLANWIHDMMWTRVVTNLDDVDGVDFVDKGVTHDIYVGLRYRARLKKHTVEGGISSYATPAALEFITQDPNLLDLSGYPQINLTAGYEWNGETQTMGKAVLSLRDGSFDQAIWVVELPDTASGIIGTTTPITPVIDGPPIPTIDVPALDAQADADKQGQQAT